MLLRLFFLLLIPLASLSGQDVSLLGSTQFNWMNKSYQDPHYVTNNWLSFPVGEGSWSLELKTRTTQGHILGGGFAQTWVTSGQWQEGNVLITQPTTLVSMPYLFIGQDWHWIDVELGLGWYLTVVDTSPDPYLSPSGTMVSGRAGGLTWSRSASFTTPVFLLRLLPESTFHIKFRMGREDFNLAEDFFNIELVLPTGAWRWSVYASIRTPQDFLGSGTVLTSNQRLGVGGVWNTGNLSWGLKLNYLLNPEYAGTGAVDFTYRWGASFLWSWKFEPQH